VGAATPPAAHRGRAGAACLGVVVFACLLLPGAAQAARHKGRAAVANAEHPAALRSSSVLVLDASGKQVLFEKNAEAVVPIASLTKLMTALVVLEARQDMEEVLAVTDADVDGLKHAASRLRVGTSLRRADLLHIALMSSENRAASALGRNFPGGLPAFVAAMNRRAASLGMVHTRYVEPTGLSSENVSSAQDLAKLVMAAQSQPVIRAYTTDHEYAIAQGRRTTLYHNSNSLVANPGWDITLQKTGYITEAGRCMVMLASIAGRPVVMIFLDSQGKLSRFADAERVRSWLTAVQHTRLAASP
jgi:D-alanyl-D-alanine endopeptidase (penicillin-binding protein 7)